MRSLNQIFRVGIGVTIRISWTMKLKEKSAETYSGDRKFNPYAELVGCKSFYGAILSILTICMAAAVGWLRQTIFSELLIRIKKGVDWTINSWQNGQ